MTSPWLRKRLRDVPIPEEHDARERAWEVVHRAFAEREPVAWPRRHTRPLLAAAVAAAVIAGALSPPGRAVFASLREAIGVERAAPALFSLPTDGRVLVNADAGAWVVRPDGSKRLLAGYTDAAWSPFGRFVVATRSSSIAALQPNGLVRWTLARRHVASPRWGGTRVDTRVAYRSGSTLRIVPGDGVGDRLLAPRVEPAAAPAWRPGARHVVAYVDGTRSVSVTDADTGAVLWRRRPARTVPFHLEWTGDGERLLVVGSRWIATFDAAGRRRGFRTLRARAVTAALAPDGRRLALVQKAAAAAPSTLVLLDARRLEARPRRVFMGSGFFNDVAWSPNGRWLLVAWSTADQWLFIRTTGRRRIDAVADVREQFGGGRFPDVAGWCCAD